MHCDDFLWRPQLTARSTTSLALLALAAALTLTLYVGLEKAPLAGDLWLTQQVQSAGWFARPAEAFNWVGDWVAWPFTLVFLAVVLRRFLPRARAVPVREYRAAIVALTLLIPLSALNSLLKGLVQSPRPLAADGAQVDYFRDSYGFPSGHVFHDVLLFGAMAILAPLWLPRRLVWPVRASLLAVIVLSGPSRVFVGAHWPGDTVGGYLWGSASLLAALAVGKWLAGRMDRGAGLSES